MTGADILDGQHLDMRSVYIEMDEDETAETSYLTADTLKDLERRFVHDFAAIAGMPMCCDPAELCSFFV